MVSMPRAIEITLEFCATNEPSPPNKIPYETNKTVNPETNSIEEFFSQLKHYIKKESPNIYENIDTTIKDVLANKIKKEHLTNYLKHSYRIYK